MAIAYCFSCAAEKTSPIASCGSCKKSPATESDLVKSLILSEDISTQGQLAHFANELRSNLRLSAPDSLVAKARAAAADSKYQRMLTTTRPSGYTSTEPQRKPIEQPRSASRPTPSGAAPRLTTTALHQSAFAVLGVTTRDNRRRIVELAEAKALEVDHDVCQKARSDLTNPRTRLSAEMGWLPGVSPRKASQLVDSLLQNPMATREESGLPTLAHLNLLAAAFESVDGEHDADDLAGLIQRMGHLADELSPDEVLRDINEDRAVSGFVEVKALDQIEAELTERKRYYRNAIKGALNKLPPTMLIQAMTATVDGVTAGGEQHAPGLIDELVDTYEVETQGVLQMEAENVHKLIKAARDAADSGETAVRPFVDKLDIVTRNWDMIAQPIQLSAKARGIDHQASRELAYEIRSLAIDLFNKHDMLAQSQRLTSLLKDLFVEIPDVSERVEQDADALQDILQNRREAAALDPIRKLLEVASKHIEQRPSNADREGQRLLDEGMNLLRAAPIKASSAPYREAKNLLAFGIMQCAIAYGNKTSKWLTCISLLESALELASDASLRRKLNDNLSIVRTNQDNLGDLEPIKEAPSLKTINGVGGALYGNTDQKPDGSYMATYYFVVLAIPILPIARYRVIPTDGGYRFLGKGPLRAFDKWHIAVSACLIAYMFF